MARKGKSALYTQMNYENMAFLFSLFVPIVFFFFSFFLSACEFRFIVFFFFSFFSSTCEFRFIERIGAHGKQNPDIIMMMMMISLPSKLLVELWSNKNPVTSFRLVEKSVWHESL